MLHERIVTRHLLAFFGALAADFGAESAGGRMEVRRAQHEISADLANLGTVEEKANVFRARVIASKCQTVLSGFGAERVAIQTVMDAFAHFFADCV